MEARNLLAVTGGLTAVGIGAGIPRPITGGCDPDCVSHGVHLDDFTGNVQTSSPSHPANAELGAIAAGVTLLHNSSTNPHPIVFLDASPVAGVEFDQGDYVKATATLKNAGGVAHDIVEVFYGGLQSSETVDSNDTIRFAFQFEATALTTGRYDVSVRLESETDQLQGGFEYDDTIDGEVNIVNRVDTEFGNRWNANQVDRLHIDASNGALLERGDGVALWHKEVGGSYDPAEGDLSFSTLEVTGTTGNERYTLTDKFGNKSVFYLDGGVEGLLEYREDTTGNRVTYAYTDADGDSAIDELDTVADQFGRKYNLDYYASGHAHYGKLKSITFVTDTGDDTKGPTTEYRYKTITVGSNTRIVLNEVWGPDPDGAGPLLRAVTSYEYADFGDAATFLMTRFEDSEGNLQSFEYDRTGRVNTIVSRDGAVRSLQAYETTAIIDTDLIGFDVSNPAPFQHIADLWGRQIDGAGQTTEFKTNRFGLPAEIKGPLGNVTKLTYQTTTGMDHVANKIEEPDPDGSGGLGIPTTTLTYSTDGKANLLKASLPDGAERTWEYDSTYSQVTKFTDELGRTTFYGVDSSNGNVLYVQHVIGTKDSVTYDDDDQSQTYGQVLNVVDDIVTSFLYTGSPSGQIPVGGQIESIFDANGNRTDFEYYGDHEFAVTPTTEITSLRKGRLKKITFPKVAGETAAPTRQFEYDELGNISKITDTGDSLNRSTSYDYDDLNRLLKTTLPDPDGAGSQVSPVYEYFYDSLNRLTAAIDPIEPTGTSSVPTVSPTTATIDVHENAADTRFDLTAHFSDDEDSVHVLTYEIVSNSNSALFDSLSFEPGTLVLDYADDQSGTAVVKVRASDTDGGWSSDLTITVTVDASQFRINDTTTHTQTRPMIAATDDGGYISSWLEFDGGTSQYRVMARRFDGGGNPLTNDIEVQGAMSSSSFAYPSSIAVSNEGFFVVAWHQNVGVGSDDYNVYFRRMWLDGTALDDEETLITTTANAANHQYVPRLATTPDGGFIVTFYGGDSDTTSADIYFRRFDSDGNAIEDQQIANTVTAGGQFHPSIATAPDGSFVISWEGYNASSDKDIYSRAFDAQGNPLNAADQVLNIDSGPTLGNLQARSDVAYLDSQNWIVVWESDIDNTSSSDYEVRGRMLTENGLPIGTSELSINATTTGQQRSPEVASNDDGGFTVAWYGNGPNDGTGIHARRFDADGAASTSEQTINTHTIGAQFFSDVISLSDRRLGYAWEGEGAVDTAGVFGAFTPGSPEDTGPFRVLRAEVDPVLRGPVQKLLVTFSEPVDGTTVQTTDFTLTDPGSSSVTISSASLVGTSQVLLGLAGAISVVGDYKLTVGPSISKVGGGQMDQDRDGSAGETTEDKYSATFRYTKNLVTTYQYDAVGRQTGMVDTGGFHTASTYTGRGQLASFTDPLGRATRYEYDPRGLISKLILPDPDGPTGSLTSPTTEYTYDAGSNLIKTVDAEGNETEYVYDIRHRTTELRQPKATGTNSGLATDPTTGAAIGPVTKYAYNDAGELIRTTDAEGHHRRYMYDAAGRIARTSDSATSSMTIDNGDATPQFALTGFWTHQPDSGGFAGSDGDDDYHDATGTGNDKATWEFSSGLTANKTYEVFVTWVAISGPLGNASDAPYTVYDGDTTTGTSLGTTDVDQRVPPSLYDDHVWISLGEYTITGTKLTVQLTTQADNFVVADAVRIVEVDGPVTQYQYDDAGNLTLVTDALGSATEHVYDARHRRTDTYLPNPSTGAADKTGPRTQFAYDAVSNLTSLTDPSSDATTWAYDGLDRVTTETNALNDARSYQYDAVGNLTQFTDRIGRVTKYTYDKRYLMTTEEWFADINDTTADRTLSFTFDAVGQLTAASDPSAAYDYEYDALGRATKVTSDLAGMPDDVIFDQVFDSLGRRTEVDATIGTTADFLRKFQYDALSRMSQVTQEGQIGGNTVQERRVDFEYNDIGQFTKISRFYDLDGGATYEAATSTYGYNALGRLNSLDHKKGTTLISGYDWTHDRLHRVTSMDFTNSLYDAEDVNSYSYDKNDQITAADLDGTANDEDYAYDENGNRTNSHLHGTGYVTGTNNQLLEDGTYRYTYDAEGNRTEKYKDNNNNDTLDTNDTDVTLFEWDHRNRLVKVTLQDNYGTDTWIYTYEYDTFDRRVKIHSQDPVISQNQNDTYYVWDGQQLALQFYDSNGSGHLGLDLKYRFLYGPGIDQVLSQDTDTAGYWLLTDHLGTTRDLIDADGDHVEHFEYDAYGNVLSGSLTYTKILFAGRELDTATGLYYVRARWYDPSVGRWISEDPIGFSGGDTNLARYVGNSPVNFTDPSGLFFSRGLVIILDEYQDLRARFRDSEVDFGEFYAELDRLEKEWDEQWETENPGTMPLPMPWLPPPNPDAPERVPESIILNELGKGEGIRLLVTDEGDELPTSVFPPGTFMPPPELPPPSPDSPPPPPIDKLSDVGKIYGGLKGQAPSGTPGRPKVDEWWNSP